MSYVSDDQIQAGLISYLKGKATIIAVVTVVEIREDQWQGEDFDYPNLRVRLISNIPGTQNCPHVFECGIQVFTEDSSSKNADRIAGIIANELQEKGFSSNSLAFTCRVTNQVPAVRNDIRTWRSEVLIRGTVA